MSKLTDFRFENEEEVVTRILKSLHAAIDRDFPNAPPPPPKYSQTIFQMVEETRNDLEQFNRESTKPENETIKAEIKPSRHIQKIILFLCIAALTALWVYKFLA